MLDKKILVGVLTMLASLETSADENGEKSYAFYVSGAALLSHSPPSLIVERKDPQLKWFDDKSDISLGPRVQIGLQNFGSGYTLAYRGQSLSAAHTGSASRFQCFIAFCAWVDGSIVNGLEQTDRVVYRIHTQQIWLTKRYSHADISFNIGAGMNVFDGNVKISGPLGGLGLNGEVPFPFLVIGGQRSVAKNLDLVVDLHLSSFRKSGTDVLFYDAELEGLFTFSKNLKVAFGYNLLNYSLHWKDPLNTYKISIPQNQPYIKAVFVY